MKDRKLFRFLTYEIKFPMWPHKRERDLAASRKFSCSHPVVSLSTLAKDGIESACGKNTQQLFSTMIMEF